MERSFVIKEVDGDLFSTAWKVKAITETELRRRIEEIQLIDWNTDYCIDILLHGEPKKDEWEEWLKTIPVPGAYETEEEHLRRVRAWLDKDPRVK